MKKFFGEEKKRSLHEEVTLIRKRIGWVIFWLVVLAIGIGKLIPY